MAEFLREWLPTVLAGSVTPFVSSQDIAKGERGLNVISTELETVNYGIVAPSRRPPFLAQVVICHQRHARRTCGLHLRAVPAQGIPLYSARYAARKRFSWCQASASRSGESTGFSGTRILNSAASFS